MPNWRSNRASSHVRVMRLDGLDQALAGTLASLQSGLDLAEDDLGNILDRGHQEVGLGSSQLVIVVGAGSIQTDGPSASVIYLVIEIFQYC